MIPKPEEVLKEKGVLFTDFITSSTYVAILESHKEYGRRLLDHVAEKAKEDGNLLTIWEILKIKDEL